MLRRTLAVINLLGFAIAGVSGRAQAASGSDRLAYTFEYDDSARITKIVDPAGRAVRIAYELFPDGGLRRLVRTRADRVSTVRELDAQGRLSTMRDAAGLVQYGYDDLGRLASVHRQGGPAVQYGYDTLDRLTSLEVGDFYRIKYGYDFLGRLATVQTPAGEIRYEYLTGQGELRRVLPNGIKTIWRYAPDGRLTELIHADAQNRVIAEYGFERRPDGLLAGMREYDPTGTPVTRYEYDKVGRLLGSSDASRPYRFEYDLLSNPTKMVGPNRGSQTMTYDWAGRLTSVGNKPCASDGAGNLTKLSLGGEDLVYRHDQDGLLVEASSSRGRATYQYDGNGGLLARTEGGRTATFVANPGASIWQPLVSEDKAAGRTLWVWGGGRTPVLAIHNGVAEYYLQDHLGSVRAVVDAQAKVVQRFDYEPYGAEASAAGPATGLVPRFAGMFWDSIADVYVAMARAYSPRTGRFLQPQAQATGMSYAYAGHASNTWMGPYADVALPGEDEAVRDAAQLFATGHPIQANWTLLRYSLGTAPKIFERLLEEPFVAVGAEAERKNNKALAIGSAVAGTAFVTTTELVGSLPLAIFGAFSPKAGLLDYALLAGALPIFRAPLAEGVADTAFNRAISLEGWVDRRNRLLLEDLTARESKWTKELFVQRSFWAKLVTGSEVFGPYSVLNEMVDLGLRTKEAIEELSKRHEKKSEKRDPRGLGKRTELSDLPDNPCKHGLCGPPPPSPPSVALPTMIGGGGEGWDNRCKGGFCGNGDRGWDKRCKGGFCGSGPPPSSGGTSRVGGVYLSGAGRALEGIGLLDGVAIDANNSLVLLGSGGPVKLPPLRLDDVVTVFRSVYLYGEGPSVTIDPVPDRPSESAMIVKHGRATEDTYVGWVLYQADRLMKGYSMGYDNLTNQPISTTVAGYSAMLDRRYFGGVDNEKPSEGGQWQRFWIVPEEVRRFGSPRRELTLFDIPLGLRTQAMVWKNGQLVDDLAKTSSPGASKFRDWFTSNYDAIAAERFLTPPKESGIDTPVPVFAELRRIALVTAIAERLRDSGVPMPWWMRDYQVKPVPFEKITPGLEVTRSNGSVRARIFGGVDLSVPDGSVRVVTAAADVAKLPAEQQARMRALLARASDMKEDPQLKLAGLPPLEVRPTELGGAKVSALSMPGADTLGLNPCQLQETDLEVPIADGFAIKLERKYNSFFAPVGTLGKGWTLDLPRLDAVVATVGRSRNGQVEMHTAFELVSPLGSVYARFNRLGKVPELGGGSQIQIPDDSNSAFWGLAAGRPSFLSRPTAQLLAKNGGAWHFGQQGGEIVATEQGGWRTVYERDERGRLTRIVGGLGKSMMGWIALTYDAQGRLREAKSHSDLDLDEAKVSYEYDRDGRLVSVAWSEGKVGYRYQGDLLTAVIAGGAGKTDPQKVVRRFRYNARGQLESVAYGDTDKVTYQIETSASGSTLKTTGQAQGGSEMLRLDSTMRPLQAQLGDGTRGDWRYPADGSTETTLVGKNAERVRYVEAAGGRSRVLELGKRYTLAGDFNKGGRLGVLKEDGVVVLKQEWNPDGTLRSAGNASTSVYPEYDEDGLVKRVLVTSPGQHDNITEWRSTKLDVFGRQREITDSRGLKQTVDYDSAGRVESAGVVRDGKTYGFRIQRDDRGRVADVTSSWGNSHYAYNAAGQLAKVETRRGEAKELIEWEGGALHKVTKYDGGVRVFEYDRAPQGGVLLRQMTTPERLVVRYSHDSSNRLTSVALADVSRVRFEYDGNGRVKGWSYEAGPRVPRK